MPDEDKPEVSQPDPPQRREPATGERADHQASAPGVELPDEGQPDGEPEPGEHPNP